MIRIGFLVYPGVTMLDVSGPAEAFARAPGDYGSVFLSATGGPVRTSSGMVLADTVPVAECEDLDTLVVPGADSVTRGDIDPVLLDSVAVLAPRARRVASVCTGAFVLAGLGLLDGRRVATHWRHAAALARRHPAVTVEPDRIRVQDGRFHSSAGITAGIDLALALIAEDLGEEAARATARELVMFLHRPGGQLQYSEQAAPTSEHEVLGPLLRQVRADLAAPHTVGSMAAAAALSPRHLSRLFSSELGTTPARWLETVRVDRARRLLLEGLSVTATAQHAGFGSDETLRRAFDRRLGTTPTEYRARFSGARTGPAGTGSAEPAPPGADAITLVAW